MSKLRHEDSVSIAQDNTSRFNVVQEDGSYPTDETSPVYGVTKDDADSGELQSCVLFGVTKLVCTDTGVSRGDQLQASGTDGEVQAHAGATGDRAIALALEGCDANGQHIRVFFYGMAGEVSN